LKKTVHEYVGTVPNGAMIYVVV